jgi:GNAT superfamily N-acetyltransferase
VGRRTGRVRPARDRGPLPVPALQAGSQGVVPVVPRRGTRPPAPRADPRGNPRAKTTSGLVAYIDGEPVGWCAVEPRTAYSGLLRVYRVPWEGRSEDKTDDRVWAVTCVFTRAGYRRRGITYSLVQAAVDFARERGARALEGYPMITEPGKEVIWDEILVGTRNIFAAAGFSEVSHPTPRRVVMRIDFRARPTGGRVTVLNVDP